MNIIFLDIDGVLNDADFFEEKKIKCELLRTEFSKADRLNNIEYIILSKKNRIRLIENTFIKKHSRYDRCKNSICFCLD